MKTPPIHFIRERLFDALANRNTSLVNLRDREEITEQAYNAMQFPADAASVISRAISLAFDDFNRETDDVS